MDYFQIVLSHRAQRNTATTCFAFLPVKVEGCCCTEVNNDLCFSEDSNGVQLKNIAHANGHGVDNQAFEIEVCITFILKENGTS